MVTITATLNELDSMLGNNIDSDGQECILREDYKDLPPSVKRRPPAVGLFYKTGLYQDPNTGLCQWAGCAYGVWRWYGKPFLANFRDAGGISKQTLKSLNGEP